MMRVLAAAAVFAIVGAAQGTAASAVPGVSPEEVKAGCVHTDLRRCMISLGTAFWFDMRLVTGLIAKRNELDVNGRTAHRNISFDIQLPGNTEMTGITLTLASPSPNDEVVKIELTLPEDPEAAHTASEYDRTQLYDVVSVVLGSKCPGLDRLALYRFYENAIKPREHVKTEIRKYGIFSYTSQTVDTEPVPFCGGMFSLHRREEFKGPPDLPDRSPKGVSFIDIE